MLEIKVFCMHPKHGCISELVHDGEFICYMIEAPWKNNIPFESCLPQGVYRLKKHISPNYGDTVMLHNPMLGVLGQTNKPSQYDKLTRYSCIVHPANFASELKGCIAPGMELNVINNIMCVKDSRKAFNKIIPILRSHDYLRKVITV